MRLIFALGVAAFLGGCQTATNQNQDDSKVYNVFYRCPTDEYVLISETIIEDNGKRLQREFACAQHPDKDKYPSMDGKIYSKEDLTSKDMEDDGVYNIYYH